MRLSYQLRSSNALVFWQQLLGWLRSRARRVGLRRVYLGAEGAVVGGPPPLSTAVTFSCCPAGTFPAPSSRFFVRLLSLLL
jgi:hypothetical protein